MRRWRRSACGWHGARVRRSFSLCSAISSGIAKSPRRLPSPESPGARQRRASGSGFRAGEPGAETVADDCGHAHAPDPSTLGGAFTWRNALGTVVAAGIRPCSGAILILVFALAQGLFAAGVAATLAMALGTAVTTGALASLAVFAKTTAMRIAAGEDSRLTLIARSFEFAAALAVLTFGIALLLFGARGMA